MYGICICQSKIVPKNSPRYSKSATIYYTKDLNNGSGIKNQLP